MKLAGIELKRPIVLATALLVLVKPSSVAWAAASQVDPLNSATNRVLSLDGKTAFMRVANSRRFHSLSNALTLELWFKAASFPNGQGAVSSLIRKNINQGEENFFLRFRSIDGQPWIEMTPGLQIGGLRASYQFATNRWYHLSGTYSGRELAVFVNGTQVKSEPFSGTMSIDGSEIIVGKGDPEWSSGEFFHGAVDEIRIWSVVRSPKEIQADMNGKSAGNEPGLIAYWNFDSGTASDLSSNPNDGHLEGGALIIASPVSASGASVSARPSEEKVDSASAGLPLATRLETLEALWNHLNEIYPALEYKGIYGRQWIEPAEKRVRAATSDAEFYDVLLRLMATLKDTHTRIVSYPGQPTFEAPNVALNRVEAKVAVLRAAPESGLSAGDVIVAIDGQPVEECLAQRLERVCNSTERGREREACEQLLRGKPASEVTLTVLGEDGATRQVTLRRDSTREFRNEPAIASRWLTNSVGIIRISHWGGNDLVARFDQALEEFNTANGLIIDVRGNGGGSDQLADEVNGRLTEKTIVSSIDLWRKSGTDQYQKTIGWVKPRGPWAYKGRVAVLIDEGCASACEHFVSGIEAMGNVLLVGLPTNGAGGGPTGVSLPDGTKVRISRALGLRVNGVVFEGHGIPPHILSAPTLSDLRKGRDAALQLAQDWILSDQPIPERAQALHTGP